MADRNDDDWERVEEKLAPLLEEYGWDLVFHVAAQIVSDRLADGTTEVDGRVSDLMFGAVLDSRL